MFDVVYLFGVTAVGEPLHSHPKNITQITPRPDLLLSKAFSDSSFTNTDLLTVCRCEKNYQDCECKTDVGVEKFS